MEIKRILLILLWWTQILNFAQTSTIRGPPKILGRDFKPLQVVRVGQEFRVTCPVEGDPSPIIDWFKDGEPITAAWSRFRVSSKALRIRSVLAKDSGIYECKGVNGFGSQIARTRLVVADDIASYSETGNSETWINPRVDSYSTDQRASPVFTHESLEQAGKLHISSGNSIRFRCETEGSPASKVTWFKDGKSVNDKMWRWSTWTLVLSKLSSEDSGSYSCRASNGFGKNELNIQLEITDMIERRKPSFALGYPNNTTVLAGNEAVMECVVRPGTTSIPPHIKWLKRVPQDLEINGQTMKYKHRLIITVENQHFLVIQDGEDEGIRVNVTQVNGTFVSRLIFKETEAGVHDGIYVCLATNSVGYSSKDARLTILAGAQIVENSASGIPFPLVVFGMSMALSILVITCACGLRKYQKGQEKQTKSISVRQLSTPSVGSSGASSYQKNSPKGVVEQRQLLVVPRVHPSTLSNMICQKKVNSAEPAIEIALSRCSYCGDQSSEISAFRTYEHCYNGSYVSSTSHSLHCDHWR